MWQSFEKEVAFDMYIGDRVVTKGILECGHSRVAACWGKEQTKGYVDLRQFSLSDQHLRNTRKTNTNVQVTLRFIDHFGENSSTYPLCPLQSVNSPFILCQSLWLLGNHVVYMCLDQAKLLLFRIFWLNPCAPLVESKSVVEMLRSRPKGMIDSCFFLLNPCW